MESNNNESEMKAIIQAETAGGADATVTAPEGTELPAELSLVQQRSNLLAKRGRNHPLTTSQELQLRRLNKQILAQEKERVYFSKMMEEYGSKRKKLLEKFFRQVTVVQNQLGKKNYKMLKDLFTVQIPELKDAEGNITREAATQVNWQGLMAEARNVTVMERQSRIDSGKRKKTTGRGSDRAAHSSHLKFLLNRNAQESVSAAQKAE